MARIGVDLAVVQFDGTNGLRCTVSLQAASAQRRGQECGVARWAQCGCFLFARVTGARARPVKGSRFAAVGALAPRP